MKIISTIANEIENYINGTVTVRNTSFSTYDTEKKIERFSNGQYKNGNIDSQGNIKYWYDISAEPISNEVKNTDFDTKDVMIESEGKNDGLRQFLANLELKGFMHKNKEGVRINEIIEEASGWGNVLIKKLKDAPYYENLDLTEVYVINQIARTVSGVKPDSQVIERHVMTYGELEAMKGTYNADAVDFALDNYGDKGFLTSEKSGTFENTEMPYYEVYERNGEVSLEDLKNAQGKDDEIQDGDDKEFVLAKMAVILKKSEGKDTTGKVLFAGKIKKMPYYEYHRGRYTGRWLRLGIYETLFNVQIRANENGNEIARALEFAGKQIFQSKDDLIYENILTDLQRGDIIQTEGLSRVDMAAHDIGNYITEWNNLMALRNELTNSSDIVGGDTPAGMPFKLGRLVNQNANKHYEFIREKLSLTIEDVYNECIMPNILNEFKAKDAITITGDSEIMERYYGMRVESWYLKNLHKMPPHGQEVADTIKEGAMAKLMKNKEERLDIEKGFWDDFKARAKVVIAGEGSSMIADLETLANFIQLEQDPVRRTALIEMAMKRKGIDIVSLPKTEVQQAPLQTPPTPQDAVDGLAGK